MRKLTEYPWPVERLTSPVDLLVVSDLHDAPFEDLFAFYPKAQAVLAPGDIVNRYAQSDSNGLAFLRESAKRLPTFFSFGNHEYRLDTFAEFLREAEATGATILHNRYVRFGELAIGGWYRPIGSAAEQKPDFLPELEADPGCRILMCHKPEDYIRRLSHAKVELVVGGHAHGGQIRIFGRGLYAPGQGIFPRYTRGPVGERMLVSTGASNVVPVPRLGNPCEAMLVHLIPKEAQA